MTRETGYSILFFTNNEEPDETFYAATLDEAIQVSAFRYKIDAPSQEQLREEFETTYTDVDGVMHWIEIHAEVQ
jgi:hypothetical protein